MNILIIICLIIIPLLILGVFAVMLQRRRVLQQEISDLFNEQFSELQADYELDFKIDPKTCLDREKMNDIKKQVRTMLQNIADEKKMHGKPAEDTGEETVPGPERIAVMIKSPG